MHLSALGYPIANDSQYGGTYKGPVQVRTHAAVKKREAAEQLDADATYAHEDLLTAENKRQRCLDVNEQVANATDSTCCKAATQEHLNRVRSNAPSSCSEAATDNQQVDSISEAHLHVEPVSMDFQVPKELQDDMCLNCPDLIPPGYPTDIVPLWLHARSYSCDDWFFVCPDPAWASERWQTGCDCL